MEVFKFIHKPPYDHDARDVLEVKYNTLTKIQNKFTVQDEKNVKYLVFDSFAQYEQFVAKLDQVDRCFHEVIFGQMGQKLKFDIDADIEKINAFDLPVNTPAEVAVPDIEITDDSINDLLDEMVLDTHPMASPAAIKAENILNTVISALKDAFFLAYGRELDCECIIICESSEPAQKYSYHIIVAGYYVANNEEAREFTYRLLKLLPQAYHQFIDKGVNKSIQNFRLIGCQKAGDSRIKVLKSKHAISATYITNIDECELLPQLVVQKAPDRDQRKVTLPKEDLDEILRIVRQREEGHEFKAQSDNLFIYKRKYPSYCDFCQREHQSDNTLLISIVNDEGKISIFKSCRHYTEDMRTNPEPARPTSILIGEFMSVLAPTGNPIAPAAAERKIANWNENSLQRAMDKFAEGLAIYPSQRSLFDRLPNAQKHIYQDPKLQQFELKETLCVKAQMKMGKTKKLQEFMAANFADTALKRNIIRFISFRQTFSSNIKEKFADFTLYSDVKGDLTQDRLIIQVESLSRILIDETTEYPDLVVLDECESIFEQFNSGLLRNFNYAFAVFQWMLKYAKYVVCMDANLCDRSFRILQRIRARPIYYHCNTFKNAADDKYLITTDELKWLGVLYSCVENDERLAIPMSSLVKAKVLYKNLTSRFPDKRIKLYSSETSNAEKREHFGNVNLHWTQHDILIYTPTISAGVSFEAEHFAKIFGYFTDLSCNVETCIQMIGRIRNVGDKQFVICLNGTPNNLPEEPAEIEHQFYQSRANLAKNFDESFLQFEFGPFGEVKRYATDYFCIYMENQRIKNLSANSFVKRFITLTAATGAKISQLSNETFRALTGDYPLIEGELNPLLERLKEEHALVKQEIKAESNKSIADARELSSDEIEDIQNKFLAQQDIPVEDKHAYEKYRLRNDYRYWDRPLSEQFVAKYGERRVRTMFKNILRISACRTIEEAVAQIQKEERNNNLYILELDERAQAGDIGRRYVFERHRIALGFLKVCGFQNINDARYIHRNILAENLKEKEQLIYDNLSTICADLSIRRPLLMTFKGMTINEDRNAATYIKTVLKYINKVLDIMYGIIITNPASDDMYHIRQNVLFTMDPTDKTDRPIIAAREIAPPENIIENQAVPPLAAENLLDI